MRAVPRPAHRLRKRPCDCGGEAMGQSWIAPLVVANHRKWPAGKRDPGHINATGFARRSRPLSRVRKTAGSTSAQLLSLCSRLGTVDRALPNARRTISPLLPRAAPWVQ